MTEEEKNLLALLNSRGETNLELAILLQTQIQSQIVETRINEYKKMLQLYAKANRSYDNAQTLTEGIIHLNFHAHLEECDLPHIFSIHYYAWGGQSFGFEESPNYIRYSIYRTLLHTNLEEWFIDKKTDEKAYDRNWSNSIIQLWVTYRLVELLPIFELLTKHWDHTPDMDYYLGEIHFQCGNLDTAWAYFAKYIAAVPNGISTISRFTKLNSSIHNKKEYAPEEWHLLPQQHWSLLKINTIDNLGSHPAWHALPPNTMEAHIFLAQIATKKGDLVEAENQYYLAIRLCPDHWLAPHLQLAELLLYSKAPNPKSNKKIKRVAEHLKHYWKNIANLNAQKYIFGVSAWFSWIEEYGNLAQYLTERYPLLYTGINFYYLAERYFLAAEQLRILRTNATIVFGLLQISATMITTSFNRHDLKDMTNKTYPNIFYMRRPRLIFQLLAALKRNSRKTKTKDLRIMAYSQLMNSRWKNVAAIALIEKIQLIWQYYRDRPQLQTLLNKYDSWLPKDARCRRILIQHKTQIRSVL